MDKKQVSKLSVGLRVNRAELETAVAADLERLAPGALDRLGRLGPTPTREELARIAAGEPDGAGSESGTLPE